MSKSEEIFQLDPKKLENAQDIVARLIHHKGLYQKVLSRWSPPDSKSVRPKYIPTPDESATLESVKDAFAVYKALSETLEGMIMQQEMIKDAAGRMSRDKRLRDEERSFINIYSLYGACAEGISYLEPYLKKLPEGHLRRYETYKEHYREAFVEFAIKKKRVQFSSDHTQLLDSLLNEYAGFMSKLSRGLNKKKYESKVSLLSESEGEDGTSFKDGRNFMGATYVFFATVLDYLESEINKKEYEKLLQEYALPVQLPHTTLKGFDYTHSISAEGESETGGIQLDVSFEDIVGNEESIEHLKSILSKLFLYDPNTQKNSYQEFGELPRTSLLFAGPGTGKTMMTKAATRYCVELAEKTGKKFTPIIIDQTFKNQYFGESQKELQNLFDEATLPDGIGLIIIEDIDTLFMNRSTSREDARAESNVLSHILNLLEGVKTFYAGNWFVISTSNRAHEIDKALRDRVAQIEFHCPGAQTKEEYTELLEKMVGHAVDMGYLKISKNGWGKVADVCMEKEYNGRQIRNSVVALFTAATNFEIDPDVINTLHTEQHFHDYLMKATRDRIGKKHLTENDLINKMDEVQKTMEERKKYDTDERTKALAERYLEDRKASKLAGELFSEEIIGEAEPSVLEDILNHMIRQDNKIKELERELGEFKGKKGDGKK